MQVRQGMRAPPRGLPQPPPQARQAQLLLWRGMQRPQLQRGWAQARRCLRARPAGAAGGAADGPTAGAAPGEAGAGAAAARDGVGACAAAEGLAAGAAGGEAAPGGTRLQGPGMGRAPVKQAGAAGNTARPASVGGAAVSAWNRTFSVVAALACKRSSPG